jgi:hypothetical protein
MVISSGSDPKRFVFDAPTNHQRADSMKSELDTPKTHASTITQARVVDSELSEIMIMLASSILALAQLCNHNASEAQF